MLSVCWSCGASHWTIRYYSGNLFFFVIGVPEHELQTSFEFFSNCRAVNPTFSLVLLRDRYMMVKTQITYTNLIKQYTNISTSCQTSYLNPMGDITIRHIIALRQCSNAILDLQLILCEEKCRLNFKFQRCIKCTNCHLICQNKTYLKTYLQQVPRLTTNIVTG